MILKMKVFYLVVPDETEDTCTYVSGPFDSYIEAQENKELDVTPDDLLIVSTIVDVKV